MDIVPTEKDGNFLSKILGSNPPKDLTLPTAPDFEKGLFKDGVYEFIFDKEIDKSEESYYRMKDWLRHPGWVSRAQGVLTDLVSSERWDLAWKQAFSGKIPKSWSIWYGLTDSFKEAGKRNIQLSPTLVNAGVSHDHHLVVNETGKSQKLSPQQLGLVLGRDDIPLWNSNEIISAQRAKGMTSKEYHEARTYAEEVREKIRKARSKQGQLDSPKPQLKRENQGGDI
jgi:hypothetical protein